MTQRASTSRSSTQQTETEASDGMPPAPNLPAPGLAQRFWIYQAERFPLVAYVLSVGALVFGGLGFAVTTRLSTQISGAGFLVAFVTAFGFFWQLRVADEFKDYALDVAVRPYRPVPRGIISLGALAWLAGGVALVQLVANLWLDARLLLPLALVWGYLLLMRWEFFIHDWLTARPLPYMFSHMVIMAFIFFYVTAVDWLPRQAGLPSGLGWLLLAGYANGIVFEIGRKVRAPEDEETGVETYSGLWGASAAVLAWMGALVVAGSGITLAAWIAGAGALLGGVALLLALPAAWLAWRYVAQPTTGRAQWIDRYSALWVLILYLFLGASPWLASGEIWR